MSQKRYLPILCTVLALLIAVPFISIGTQKKGQVQFTLSPALNVLANETEFTKSAPYGKPISFTMEDIDAAFGMEKVGAVTILSLPPAEDGTLCLGEVHVLKNQTISRKDFGLLNFIPRSASVSDTSFLLCNSGDDMTYQIPCTLFFCSADNQAPTISTQDATVPTLSTISDIAVSGRFRAVDPDGDKLTFSIVSYPKKGILILEDKETGGYIYYPKKGCTGKDSFSYVAKDCYGNTSNVQTVSVTIEKSELGLVYSDLIDHRAHLAAITLTQANIMSGVEVGGFQFFYPDQQISRAEFLVMAMKSANYPVSATNEALPFADRAEISPVYAEYIACALKNGIIEGDTTDKGVYFYPNKSITRAEAAVIVQRILNLPIPTGSFGFTDADALPSWAQNALMRYVRRECLRSTLRKTFIRMK